MQTRFFNITNLESKMLYMKADGKNGIRIIVLESANLGELIKGNPTATPDKSVVIAWTPDPVWLGDQIKLVTDGDAGKIAELIRLSQLRPEVEREPSGKMERHDFKRDNPVEQEDVGTDLGYAIKQLRGINLPDLQRGWATVADRIQRALDALERIEEK